MAIQPVVGTNGGDGTSKTGLATSDVSGTFGTMVDKHDAAVSAFITSNTVDGILSLSSSDSLKLQQLMADQSIAAQTSTNVLKVVKDNIIAAARNIS